MRVGGQSHDPAALPPGKEIGYPLCRRLGLPQGRSGLVRKILPPPGFDPRTVQPVQKLCSLSTGCICVLCMDLRTRSDLFPMQQ